MIEFDAQTAEHMGALILEGSQGPGMLTRQRPLATIDLGDAWLVRGQPYDDNILELLSCMFHVVFDKGKMNILSIGLDGRFFNLAEKTLPLEKLERKIEKDRNNTENYFDLSYALRGGLINSPSAAVEYARHIIRCSRGSNTRPGEDAHSHDSDLNLHAEERNYIWHIREAHNNKEVLAFSRLTCQISE